MNKTNMIIRAAGCLVLSLMVAAPAARAQAQKPMNATGDTPAQSGFVTVKGRHFQLDGKPYYYTGGNLWYGMYLGSPGKTGDRARLAKELDQLASQGVLNLRVLAISEASPLARAVSPAVQQGLGKVDDTLWKGLDFLLDEMARRDMKAVLYLNNFWQWSGGMGVYLHWTTGRPVLDPDASGDWNGFMENSASFYRDAKANEAFRAVVKQLVTRRNTVNSRVYSADPTIMSWQLANEPRPGKDGDEKYFDVYTRWIDGTAGFIKTLAPKQLVSTGNEGWMGTAGNRDLYVKAHRSKNVDYLTFHLWAPNWSWYDPKHALATYDGAWQKMQDYLNWHINTANQMAKPIVLEEFGINRDGGSYDPSASVAFRDKFYKAIYHVLASRAAAGDAIAGSNFWAWGGAGRTHNADSMWKPGDAFVGDPPQEAQGLYCVFDTDKSTIDIISGNARQMNNLH